MKKISVITINYNNARGLERTIRSVMSQEELNFQFIIVDGGSTDGSKKVVKEFDSVIDILVWENDNGIYDAQNKGISFATGEYCLFLNSGDTLADAHVFKKITPLLKDADIVYGDLYTRTTDGKSRLMRSPDQLDIEQFMVSTLWHPCAFIKRTLFNKYGNYNAGFKIAGDYEFFIRTVLKENVSWKHLPVPVSVFDLGGISNDEKMKDLLAAERKLGWELNFSKIMIEAFEEYTRMKRSGEYKWGRRLTKILHLFS